MKYDTKKRLFQVKVWFQNRRTKNKRDKDPKPDNGCVSSVEDQVSTEDNTSNSPLKTEKQPNDISNYLLKSLETNSLLRQPHHTYFQNFFPYQSFGGTAY